MTVYQLDFEVDPQIDLQRTASAIEQALADLHAVAEAEVRPGGLRMGVGEAASLIGAVALAVTSARQIAEDLPRLVQALRQLPDKIRGLDNARIKVGERAVALRQVTEADLKQLEE